MSKSVKTLTLLTMLALLFYSSDAQLRLPLVSGIGSDVKKVIEDYPNRFINLMGEVKGENTQTTDYQCNFNVAGAEEATITRYSAKKEVCSWEALMLTTEDFEKAKHKFKALYNQLNNLSVDIAGNTKFHLKGKYEVPAEEKKFASVLFSVDPAHESVKKLRIEITLQAYEPMEWKVRVLVYDKEREDEERGKTVEE